ncbi:MAG: aminoacyl-histidine dipeptidase [Clostridia bacterium]
MGTLSSLNPEKVFAFFEKICSIPHGSGNCAALSAFIADFAKQRRLDFAVDAEQNVLIRKPASPGYENYETLILQGHLDMVCEKEPKLEFDFAKDAIQPYIDGDDIRARGTSLGGDNGIAIAMMLAILDDETLHHPQLEMLMTVDEETSMAGAFGFDCARLRGHRLINLDSEYEGVLMCSCAGGVDVVCNLPVLREEKEGCRLTLTVAHLRGGHSGVEIDKGRANANILMGRLLFRLQNELPLGIAEYCGGSRVNAIASHAEAELLIEKSRFTEYEEHIKQMETIFRKEYHASDPDISVNLKLSESGCLSVLDEASAARMISLLLILPDGMQEMSAEMPGLVQTSCNLGAASLQESAFTFTSSIRSCMETKKMMLAEKIMRIVALTGGSAALEGDYPGWSYQPDSLLKETLINAYQKVCGIKASAEAVHAGMECGIFAAGIPNLDCVSIGPTMGDVHTPQEHLSISSVQRTWKVLLTALEDARYL